MNEAFARVENKENTDSSRFVGGTIPSDNTTGGTLDTTQKIIDLLGENTKSATADTSNPFGFLTDRDAILAALNNATIAAYDLKRKQANQDLAKAEDTAYRNTKDAVSQLKNALVGSAASGGNVGASNATALQALLGLGQQNNTLVTEGLNGLNNINDEETSARRQNEVDAISQSNSAKQMQSSEAGNRYTADQARSSEALAALGSLGGVRDTNQTNKGMNDATNLTNKDIANINAASNEKVAKIGANTTQNINYGGTYSVNSVSDKSLAKTTSKKTTGNKSSGKKYSGSNKSKGSKKVTNSVVKAVIRGDYGNGSARKSALSKAGYNYSAVQKAVNSKLRK